MLGKVKPENAAHVDVLVSDRRQAAQQLVGMIVRHLVDHGLEAMGVPGHDDVRQQRECPGDGDKLLRGAAVFRGDPAVVDRPLEAMHGLALIEQIEDCQTALKVDPL